MGGWDQILHVLPLTALSAKTKKQKQLARELIIMAD